MPDYLIRLPDGTEKLIRSEKPLTDEQLAAIARQLASGASGGQPKPTPRPQQPRPQQQPQPQVRPPTSISDIFPAPRAPDTFDPAGMTERQQGTPVTPARQPAALPQQQGTPVTPARQITLWDYAPKELKKRVADLEARAQKTGGAAGAALMAEAQRTKEAWTIANFQQYYRSRIADLQAQIRAQAKRAEELEKRAKEEGGLVGANLMAEAKRVRDDIVKRIRPRIAALAEELRKLPRQDIRLGFKEDRQAQREEARISAEALKEGYKIIDPTRGHGPFTPKPTDEEIRRAKEHNRRIDELSAEAERASREIISELQVRAPISYLFSGDIQSFGLTGGAAISDAIGSVVQDPVGFVKEVAVQMGVSLARLVVKAARSAGAGPPDRHLLAAVGLGDDVADARFGEDLIEDAFDVLNLFDVGVIAKAGSLAAKSTKARIGDIVAKKAAARAEATAKALGLEDAAVDAAKASAAKAAKDEFIELIDKAEDSPLTQAGREAREGAKVPEATEQAPRMPVEEPSGTTPTTETPTGAKAAETGAQGQEPVIPKEPEAPVQQETPKASVEETLGEAKKALGEEPKAPEPEPLPQPKATPKPVETPAPEVPETPKAPEQPKAGETPEVPEQPKAKGEQSPPRQVPPEILEREGFSEGAATMNEWTLKKRLENGLPEFQDVEPKRVAGMIEEARGIDPEAVVNRVLNEEGTAATMSDAEQMAVARRMAELDDQIRELGAELDAVRGTDQEARVVDRINDALDTLHRYTEATKKAGTEWGRQGVARQVLVRSDYSFAASYARAAKAAGRPLTKEEAGVLRKAAERVEKAAEEAAKAGDVNDATLAEVFAEELRAAGKKNPVREAAKRQRAKTNVERIRNRRQQAINRLKEILGQKPDDAVYVDPSGLLTAAKNAQRLLPFLKEILEIAETFFEEGVTHAGELVRRTAEAVRSAGLDDVTDEEIAAILGRQVKKVKEVREQARTFSTVRDEIAAEFRKAKQEAAAMERKAKQEAREAERKARQAAREAERKAAQEERARKLEEARKWREKQKAAKKAEREFYQDVSRKQKEWEKGKKAEERAQRKEYEEWWKNNVAGQKAHLLNRYERANERIQQLLEGHDPRVRRKMVYDSTLRDEEIKLQGALREQRLLEMQFAERDGADTLLSVLGLPRTLLSGIDDSAPFLHGSLAIFTDTGTWASAWKKAWAYVSKSGAEKLMDELRAMPDWHDVVATGVDLPLLSGSSFEEFFLNKAIVDMPFSPYGFSQRRMDAFLTLLRYDMARGLLKQFRRAGAPITPEELKFIGQMVNTMTGRMSMFRLNSTASKTLSLFFFSPRMAGAAFEVAIGLPLWKGLRLWAKTGQSRAFKAAATRYAKAFAGMYAAALMAKPLMDSMGWELQTDMRHTDFGRATRKLPDGTTITADVFPRPFREWGRLAARMTVGSVSSTGTEQEASAFTASQALGSMIIGKLNPSISLPLAAFWGEYWGEPLDFKNDPEASLKTLGRSLGVPITIQEMNEMLSKADQLTPAERIALILMTPTGLTNTRTPLNQRRGAGSGKPALTKETKDILDQLFQGAKAGAQEALGTQRGSVPAPQPSKNGNNTKGASEQDLKTLDALFKR